MGRRSFSSLALLLEKRSAGKAEARKALFELSARRVALCSAAPAVLRKAASMETHWNTISEQSMRRQKQPRDLDATSLLLLREDVQLVDRTVFSLQLHLVYLPPQTSNLNVQLEIDKRLRSLKINKSINK